MKQFSELTKKELSELSDMQFDAYVDIELANKGISKNIKVDVNYPEFAKVGDVLPERDMIVYEVDGYTFPDLETAQKVCDLVAGLPQITIDYDYRVGSEFRYVKSSYYQKPSISVTKVYSLPKYESIKPELEAIKKKKEQKEQIENNITEDAIDYAAIDSIKYNMRSVVRNAIEFFSKADSIAKDYEKYFALSKDGNVAVQTLWTVYNVQDDELKAEVIKLINEKQ